MKLTQRHYIAIAALCFATLVFAQGYGTIGGTLQDPSGAAVPNGEVTVTNTATGVATHVTSLGDGKYLVSTLVPGTYELSAQAAGFKRYISSGIEVHVSDRLTLNIPLELGESKDTVQVTGETPLLRTEDAQMGEVINNNFISSMPQLNRNPFELMRLSGNVQGMEGTGVTAAGLSANSQSALRINGGRTSNVDFYVDGGSVNTGQGNRLSNQTPSMDAVQEFKVVTEGISAEYGRISGGYVELVTKSGTNSYHGSLYEYMFNDMFNANAWDQNALGNKKVHFRQNNYGFTLGGPVTIPKVYKGENRTFFFVDNEYLRKNQSGTLVVRSMPTALERTGDFSQTLYQGKFYPMYDPWGPQELDPARGLYKRTGLLGGDGAHVPASRISPVSKAIIALLPMPNRPSVTGSSSLNNWAGPQSLERNTFRFGVRLDHTITANQRISIRYNTFSAVQATSNVGGPLYTSASNETNGGIGGGINYNWTVRPTMLLSVRASVTHNPLFIGAKHPADFNNSFLPAIYQKYLGTNDTPQINVRFMGNFDYAQGGQNLTTNSTTYNYAATATKILSRHTVKFGGELRRYYDNFTAYGAVNSNIVNFMVNPVHQYQGDWGLGAIETNTTGLGSMLMGINNRNNIAAPTTRAMNVNYYGVFVQDDFKLTPKFTLNLGLRYDNERPTTERSDKLYFWDPSYPSLFKINPGYDYAAELKKAGLPADTPVPSWYKAGKFDPGAVMIANTPEFPSRTPQIVSNTQFAPRIGFAWQVAHNTVVRGYGGKMYLPTTGNESSYATSNTNVALSDQAAAGWHASDDGGRTYISNWENPFPKSSMFTSYKKDVLTANLQSSLDPGANVVSRTLRMPREYDWSISVQRQMPFSFVLEAAYSGNRGLGLLATDTISRFPRDLVVPANTFVMQQYMLSPNAGQTLETTITGTKQQVGLLQYQYPYYGRVQVAGINEGRSIFHALHVRVERRFSQGLSFLLNYTRSRLLDDVGGPDGQGGKTIQSVDPFRAGWGLSTLDQPHRISITYTYAFPFGKGKHWLASPSNLGEKVLDKAIGGWQISGNSIYVAGTPVTLTASVNNNVNNAIKINQTWGSYATSDHNLTPSNYQNDKQVLYSPIDPVTSGSVRRLDPAKVLPARLFILGNLPANDGQYRNPPFQQTDLSLMKNFSITEGRFVQFRAEAQNAFNIRGFGVYNSLIGSPQYGLITTAGNQPRQIQLSIRFVF